MFLPNVRIYLWPCGGDWRVMGFLLIEAMWCAQGGGFWDELRDICELCRFPGVCGPRVLSVSRTRGLRVGDLRWG